MQTYSRTKTQYAQFFASLQLYRENEFGEVGDTSVLEWFFGGINFHWSFPNSLSRLSGRLILLFFPGPQNVQDLQKKSVPSLNRCFIRCSLKKRDLAAEDFLFMSHPPSSIQWYNFQKNMTSYVYYIFPWFTFRRDPFVVTAVFCNTRKATVKEQFVGERKSKLCNAWRWTKGDMKGVVNNHRRFYNQSTDIHCCGLCYLLIFFIIHIKICSSRAGNKRIKAKSRCSLLL